MKTICGFRPNYFVGLAVWIGLILAIDCVPKNGHLVAKEGSANAAPFSQAKPDEVSSLLALVSDEYQTSDVSNPKVPNLVPYIRFLQSSNPAVREVAALSVVWQQNMNQLMVDHQVTNALPDLVGLEDQGVGGADDANATPINRRIQSALSEAIRKGGIEAYRRTNFWKEAARIFPLVRNRSSENMFQAQANANATQLMTAKMRAILWNRAYALGQSISGPDNSRASTVDVRMVTERGSHWGTVRLYNRSVQSLKHCTLCLWVAKRTVKRDREGEYMLGGVAAQAAGGSSDHYTRAMRNFMDSVNSWFANDAMPLRALIHLPDLPSGKTCEVKLFDNSIQFGQTAGAVYSVWGDHIQIDRLPLPGYKEEFHSLYPAKTSR